MRISDWSSDVGSSDLARARATTLRSAQAAAATAGSVHDVSARAGDGVAGLDRCPADARVAGAWLHRRLYGGDGLIRPAPEKGYEIRFETPPGLQGQEIGRAACRERGCQYV